MAQTNPIRHAKLAIECTADITPEPVEWIWRERIAIGKPTLIAGDAGLRKSQVAIAMAAAVSTGGPWPCGEGRAPLGNVILLSAEDDETTDPGDPGPIADFLDRTTENPTA